MSNNTKSNENSPRRLFVQTGGAASSPLLITSSHIGLSNDTEEAINSQNLLTEDQNLINKSLAYLFYNNSNITPKKRAAYAKNVIETASSMQDEGGNYFLDNDEDYEDDDNEEEEDDDDDDEDIQTDDETNLPKIEKQKPKESPNNKSEYLQVKSPKNLTSPRISLKTGHSDTSSSNESNSRTSSRTSVLSSDILKMDPNYKWLLKDLKLNNNKRVIDVTDMIEMNQKENELRIDDENDQVTRLKPLNNDNDQVTRLKPLNDEKEEEEEEENNKEQTPNLKQSIDSDNYDETKNDNSFISKLYKKLVNTSGNAAAASENEKTIDIEFLDDENDDEQDLLGEAFEKLENKKKPEIKQTHHHIIQQLNETNEDDDDDDDENNQAYANHNDSVYKQWTKNHQRHSKTYDSEDDQSRSAATAAAVGAKKRKEQQQFSKSFEVSLDDLDNLIDRVDNGIKLKKSNNNKSNDTPKKQQQQQQQEQSTSTAQATINIESLKQEWSNMFNKLEQDYKSKLDEQQKQNEFRLKQLHDEIKQSILLQQQQQEQNEQKQLKSDDFNKSTTIESSFLPDQQQQQKHFEPLSAISNKSTNGSSSPNSTISNLNSISNNSSSLPINSNNSKYITNLRLELKSKHSRHVQDLKEYYEKEMEELKRKLIFYEKQNTTNNKKNDNLNKLNGDLSSGNNSDNNSTNDTDENFSDISSAKQQQQQHQQQQKMNDKGHAMLNTDLKNSNNNLLNKLYESSQHIRYLTQENCEISNKMNELDGELKQANEKIANLEHCCTQLELQLTETIKLQDQYIRELHAEKRNLVKKMQECEELKMSCKFYEQKCDTYELKLDEKDDIITRLKTKLIQSETDLNRIEYEYKKSISLNKQQQQLQQQQQDTKPKTSATQQIQIKNQQQIPVIITNSSCVGGASTSSSSSISPSSPNSNLTNPSNKMNLTTTTSTSLTAASSTTTIPITNSTINNNNNNNSNNNGFASSTSMSQLNNRYQNETISSLNNVNNLLMTDKSNQNGPSLRRFDNENGQFSRRSQQEYQQFRQSRNMSVSPSRLLEREELNRNFKNNLLHSTSVYSIKQQQQNNNNDIKSNDKLNSLKQSNSSANSGLFKLVPDLQLKYIDHLECEFDMLMKHKQQLDAQLTRLPFKSTNSNMHSLRQSVENELTLVEKKLASVKLELRKLNIIKTH